MTMNLKRISIQAAACMMLVGSSVSVPAADDYVTVVSWGGAYQAAQRKAWFEPAAKQLGIEFKEDTVNGIADVRAQVMSGNVTWDLVQVGSYSGIKLGQEGMLEKLDYSVINDVDGIPAGMKSDYVIACLVYALAIGWNTETYGMNGPKSWKEFYDFEKFPGTRSMYHNPDYNLEAALIADGVPPDKLYPLDVDRAFKKMEQLKPHIAAWWSSGAQSAQLIKDGEVDAIGIWNGRLQNVIKDGAKAAITFNDELLLWDVWVIPKGAPHKDLAMKMLAAMSSPKIQANLPLHINYGPANNDAYDTGIIPEEIVNNLPTAPKNAVNGIPFNTQWWVDNMDEVSKRFDLFKQE